MAHVLEEFADDGTGPGVQPVAVDSQVELDPAGLGSELQRGGQGSEVQLLSVYLVSSERAGEVSCFFNWRNTNLVWTLVHSTRALSSYCVWQNSHMALRELTV